MNHDDGDSVERADGSLEFALVYDHLHRIASRLLSDESRTPSMSPTVILHEAWIRLAEMEHWADRTHFVALAARAMRQVLVDQARRRLAEKRGAGSRPLNITTCSEAALGGSRADTLDMLVLDEAISQLEAADPRAAQVVTLRFFAGLNHTEIAVALGISTSAVERDWAFARAFLRRWFAPPN